MTLRLVQPPAAGSDEREGTSSRKHDGFCGRSANDFVGITGF